MSEMLKNLFGSRNKTFKPLKVHPPKSARHKLSEYAKATLGSGNMRSAVVLPKGEDINEWLAVNSMCNADLIALLSRPSLCV
jgi:MOB kinase activator 1